MNMPKYEFEVNIFLILSACAIVLVLGLSIWHGVFAEAALFGFAVLTGIIALAIVLTKAIWFLYLLALLIPFSQSVPIINLAARNLISVLTQSLSALLCWVTLLEF